MHRGTIQFPDLLPARSLFVPCQLGDTLLQSGHLAVALLPSALPPTHPGVPPTAAQPKPLLNLPSSLVPGERPVPLLNAVLGPLGHGPPSTPTKTHTPAQRVQFALLGGICPGPQRKQGVCPHPSPACVVGSQLLSRCLAGCRCSINAERPAAPSQAAPACRPGPPPSTQAPPLLVQYNPGRLQLTAANLAFDSHVCM